jgi:hypothetical protein
VEGECWLCDGRIRDLEGASVPSLGSITVHRRCLEADLSSAVAYGEAAAEPKSLD